MTAPIFTLYPVPRRCKECGAEWTGQSFIAPTAGEAAPRLGMCASCMARDEAHQRELTKRAPAQGQPMPKPRPPATGREREPGEDEPEPWYNR